MLSELDKKNALQSAIYYFSVNQPFFGTLLQTLGIKYSTQIPTACIKFDTKMDKFEVMLNPEFFLRLSLEQRIAILNHEILHFTNKHLFRLPFISATDQERKMYNIAGDMAINQYIQNLPNGCPQCPPKMMVMSGQAQCQNEQCVGYCIDVKDWKLSNGKPFPIHRSMEEYYELIKNNMDANQEMFQESDSIDQHVWEQLTEDQKEAMLKEAKEVLTRTIEKTQFSKSMIPGGIQDLLQEVEVMSAKLNYKSILQNCIKKTVCAADRASTWKRPNKRFGNYAPGTKLGNLPKLCVYADSSGSISHTEMNTFLDILQGFLTNGARESYLALWHTELYWKKKVKNKDRVEKEVFESGGTDVSCVMKDIVDSKPDLSIVLTDGYFDESSIVPTSEVIFVISKGGNMKHPMCHLGRTIPLEALG